MPVPARPLKLFKISLISGVAAGEEFSEFYRDFFVA
jgi:hypothetical protein